jgi:dihydrofolate reductase
MTVTIAAAISLDGKLTRHDETQLTKWTSPEDQAHFRNMIATHDALVMGRGTYEAVKPKTSPEKLRVVLTSQADNFQAEAIPGQREFYNESPAEIVKRLKGRGYKKVLIVGGGGTISPFLEAKLVDSLYLTLEPRIFGTGTALALGKLDAEFKLQSQQQLNNKGSLLLVYKLVK